VHEITSVSLRVAWGEVENWSAVQDQWLVLPTRKKDLGLVYRSGRRLRFDRADSRVFARIDGGARQLVGIVADTPEGVAALQDVVARGARDLVVWCRREALAGLPVLPAGRGFALMVPGKGIDSLAGLARQTGLVALRVAHCSLVTDLAPLAKMVDLKSLALPSCGKVSSLRPLAGLKKLSVLDLTGCGPAADLAPLRELPALRTLRLASSQCDLTPLTQMPQLVDLSIACRAQAPDLVMLQKLPNLARLDLRSSRRLTSFASLAGLRNLT